MDDLLSSPAQASDRSQPYQVIARKYRPSRFADLIGQEHVRGTLENAIHQRRIAHGYILSGQRGTGKTTVARIIARCLNCVQGPTPEPCGVCASCVEIPLGSTVDVIEIDAASNRGINEMRELRENVRFRPARDRYKVFIIDEAHQITNEAFNALLKTLEEPPEWVVFILCTTEVHKIPTTIASRCQQFSFRSVDFRVLVERMRWICEQEGVEADDEVLTVIAQAGEGSVRDSLSALDQAIACCGQTLHATELRSLLGLFSTESLGMVTDALRDNNPGRMLEIVQELEQNGRSLQHFCRELSRYFRNLLAAKISGKPTSLIAAAEPEQMRLLEVASAFSEEDLTRYLQLTLDTFKELQTSLQPRLHLEIGLVRLVHAGRMLAVEQALSQLGSGGGVPVNQGSRVSAAPPTTEVPYRPPASRTPEPPPARTPPPVAPSREPSRRPPPPPIPPRMPERSSIPATPTPPPATPKPDSTWEDLPPRPPRAEASVSAPALETRLSRPEPRVEAPRVEPRPTPEPKPELRPEAPSAPAPVVAVAVAAEPADTDLRTSLHQALVELNMVFTADAIEQSEVRRNEAGDVEVIVPKDFSMSASAVDIAKGLEKALGAPAKVRVTIGTPKVQAAPIAKAPPPDDKEVTERALAHPDVQRFQQLFPDAQVRSVRNLRD
jgi:DNA polymerase III subunit gamma/tau